MLGSHAFVRPFGARARPLSCVLALLLSACGGGGGGGDGAPSVATAVTNPPPVSSGSGKPQVCAAGNPYRTDAESATTPGSLADEKRWLLDYMGAAYLWYPEIPAVDAGSPAYSNESAAYGSLEAYFEALKTKTITASGKSKDQFSFIYPTKQWKALSQSGTTLGYGAEWIFGSMTPPRSVQIAYVEPGSPAERGGLRRGDRVSAIDGVSIDDTSQAGVDTLNAALFPQTSAGHSFNLSRVGGAPVNAYMAPADVVKQPVLTAKTLDVAGKKLGYLLFNDHIATAEAQLITAVKQFQSEQISDLVLDVRYNGGGYLYIANELAAMIAGPARSSGKLFEQLRYNDKRAADTAQAAEQFSTQSCGLTADYRCASPAPLPALNLARVYVLTSASTCSASESIINGLRGIDVEVHLVGGTTCGKPYGFTAKDNCGVSYFPIEFEGTNAKGFGAYADGFAPSCAAADDLGRVLGDPTEGMLAAALSLRATGACPATAKSKSGMGKTEAVEPAGRLVRPPVRENRILL